MSVEKDPAAPAGTKAPDRPWHSMTGTEVLSELGSRVAGLSGEEVRDRSSRYGKNVLEEGPKHSVLKEVLEELTEPMILLLLSIGVLYSVWGRPEDAFTIFAVILTLVAVEVFNDLRAERTIEALNKLSEPTARVRRSGTVAEIPIEDIVPGDIIILEAGRKVPADARLQESYGLAADESALNGESLPAEKESSVILSYDTSLSDRKNMVLFGTIVVRGKGSAVVVSTGMGTELGRTASLARKEKPPKTLLQRTMNDLTKWMVVLAIGFSVLVPVLGVLLSHQDLQVMILTALSLAFATIPEELPIIITMVLALGGYRLSRRRAIIKRLQAVETLGAVTVIATDKTGTLTSNQLEISEIYPEEARSDILRIGILANDATFQGGGFLGDPLDIAFMRAAQSERIDPAVLRSQYRLRTEHTFDNDRKIMSTVWESDGTSFAAAKGSPEDILRRCSRTVRNGTIIGLDEVAKDRIRERITEMAARGLRVVGLAERPIDDIRAEMSIVESKLIFVGLVGMIDPPRPDAISAIKECHEAGIRTIMITGDHPLTAEAVAARMGLDGGEVLTGKGMDGQSDEELRETVKGVSVYARTSPEHKLRIVKALRANGDIIAVTGDGINDAPALASADIGIAMGEGGTDVARESADMVLVDNNFATITGAVEEGRKLFANLRKGVRYYLACKVALISITLLAVLLLLPIPFTPLQIILLELFMDLGASAAFVAERAEEGLMKTPPWDPRSSFMDRRMVTSIFVASFGLIGAVSIGYVVTISMTNDVTKAQTVAFVTWLVAHVLLALNLRSEKEPLLELGVLSNHTMIIWGVAAWSFAVVATSVPQLHEVLKTTSLTTSEWVMVLVLAFAGTFWIEVRKYLLSKRKKE